MDTPDELRAAAHIEHLHSLSRHPAYGPAYAPDVYAESLEQVRTKVWASMDKDDISDEISTDDFLALVKAGDPNAVGRYVLSQVNGWADRVALRQWEAA